MDNAKIQEVEGRIEHCERMKNLYTREAIHNRELYDYYVRAADTHWNNKESMEYNVKEMVFKLEELKRDLEQLERDE